MAKRTEKASGAAGLKPHLKGEGKQAQAPGVKLTPSARAEQKKADAEEKKRQAELKAEQEKEARDLFGNSVNGNLLAKTSVNVTVSKTLLGVRLYQDGTIFKFVHEKVEGTGDSIAEAMREFKKAYKAAN